MKAAFIIFDQMTTLDLIGAYDPLTRLKSMNILPEFEWDMCSLTQKVADDRGLRFFPDTAGEPLGEYDLIFVPGGFGTRSLQFDTEFTAWIQTASSAKLKVSVCTGALLLGSAGFLAGKRATTHPIAFNELEPYCQSVVDQRVVDEGDVITGRGVSSSIDLGLFLVERLAGADARRRIAQQMDYPYWNLS
ncbi:DJ-1/PfpI family protein [Desulfogranum japonicum]|uniref:DJ-1/PfpI family protein n=1 Tax=Desulfogranum japonicum TaxID=231447 RepID=UPI000421FF6B|nr:DJ-1/PfpI family protein [Desulfogranum japonicum]